MQRFGRVGWPLRDNVAQVRDIPSRRLKLMVPGLRKSKALWREGKIAERKLQGVLVNP